VVPNAQLLATSITILGKQAPQRLSVYFNIDFRYAPSQVCELVTEALQAPIDNVARNPAAVAVCTDLAKDTRETFIAYAVRYSIIDLADEDATASRLRARIYSALRRADIPLSVPALLALTPAPSAGNGDHATVLVDILKQLGLFSSFTDEELEKLARSMSRVLYTAGERIMRQGAVARWLYVLASGRVDVRTKLDGDRDSRGDLNATGRPIPVSQLSAPDYFGEMGLMTGEPRSADVFAATDVECFRLDKDAFQSVLLARPKLAEELSERLAARRSELVTVRDGAEAGARHRASERDRILGALRGFFGM